MQKNGHSHSVENDTIERRRISIVQRFFFKTRIFGYFVSSFSPTLHTKFYAVYTWSRRFQVRSSGYAEGREMQFANLHNPQSLASDIIVVTLYRFNGTWSSTSNAAYPTPTPTDCVSP